MGIKYWYCLQPKKGADKINTFTFIETNQSTMAEGMVCDPMTGMCGPLPTNEEKEVAQKKEEDADE